MNKGDIIKDGKAYFSIFCIMESAVYVKRIFDVKGRPDYTLMEDSLREVKILR